MALHGLAGMIIGRQGHNGALVAEAIRHCIMPAWEPCKAGLTPLIYATCFARIISSSS